MVYSLPPAEDLGVSWRRGPPGALLAGRGLGDLACGPLPVVRALAPVGGQADTVVLARRTADG